ncbi:MAG: glycosyltransferase [Verrucomicrobiae bacterium]|nr:glycosyltransferase [Verrucomicrobiae bacterium]
MNDRVRLDGRFFRAGPERFLVRGVAYGAFAPNAAGEPFPEPARALTDLDALVELGANTIRLYDIPPPWLLDAAAERGLRLFITTPWTPHAGFLGSRTQRRATRTAILAAVQSVAHHPAVFAIAIGNEIPPDIVRWNGTRRVAAFLDEVLLAARDTAPECLFTYANYPPTEFLHLRHLDFVTFNVFLHNRPALVNYLVHLQTLADGKPLLLGECGVDARREGAARQAEILSWTLAATVTGGLAGAIVFAFTDDWHRNGQPVTDWEMGLTSVTRERKPAFAAVRARFTDPPPQPARSPRVTVVVAAYNAAATLRDCLDSLLRLHHPDLEVIVVDDGSTDATPEITQAYPQFRTLRLPSNLGLSHARNLGIRSATGEIIAFTDADCRVDPDWLRFLVAGLLDAPVAGIGGPNLLPPDDPPVAALVMAAPGGPMHVLLDDRFAEHVPGCNMAFWKWALEAIGGFDPVFRQAGDDVDVCWRLQRRGWRLGFAPSGFVWHHRRPSVREYLRQQAGYGAAEALLLAKHPTRFNALGAARWQGRICAPAEVDLPWRRPTIFRGLFATGLFQTLYTPASDPFIPLFTSLEYHVAIALPLVLLSLYLSWLWPVAFAAMALPVAVALLAALRTPLPRTPSPWWARPLLALLHYLQPIVRGAARYATRFGLGAAPSDTLAPGDSLETQARVYAETPVRERAYWSATWRERQDWIQRLVTAIETHRWPCRTDSGWADFDIEVFGPRWTRVTLVTVAEPARDRAQILRCRLHPRWTLATHLVVWGSLATLLLVLRLLGLHAHGLWLAPLILATLGAWFHRQGRTLQCRLTVILDDVARAWGLTPVESPASRHDLP